MTPPATQSLAPFAALSLTALRTGAWAGRKVRSTVVLVAALAGFSGVAAASSEAPTIPSFVFQPIQAIHAGAVYGVYQSRHADLVLVVGGFDVGFRTGMVCRVREGLEEVGEIMLVEVRENSSSALILGLEAGQVIRPGHSIRTKTVLF